MIQRRSRHSRIPRHLRTPWFWTTFAGVWALAGEAIAAGGGKPVTKIVNVIDTRHMAPGFVHWVSDVYNTNLWLFGLVVVTVMAGMGITLGFVFDKLVGLLGINLGKLDHHE